MSDRQFFGLAIDPDTNDLFIDGNSLAVVRDAEAVGQHARQRLMTFRGEWFLDTTAGVTWLDEIFGRAYDPALAEAIVKTELVQTDGVESIDTFAIRFDRTTRGVIIDEIAATTVYDDTVNV
jgi:hypothetical protein